MRKTTPPEKFSQQVIDKVMAELWDNAVFNPDTFKLVDKIASIGSTRKVISEAYLELSTLRNRNLINIESQKLLKNTVVGFFGLSVGSHAALTWVTESRPDVVKISDPDSIDPTNLNRLRVGWGSIGELKTDSVVRQMLAIHPNIEIISSIKTDFKSVVDLFDNTPRLDVVVDEIDDLSSKVWLRKLARERKIPLVSATDVGDNVMVDVERYDLKPPPKPFLGRVLDLDVEKTDFSELPFKDRVRVTMQVVGFDACSEDMLDSLLAIGKTIKTWPQLAATSTIAGGVVTTVIKKILLGEKVQSGRYQISLDDTLVTGYRSPERERDRSKKVKMFKRKFDM